MTDQDVIITTGSRLHFGLLDVATPFGGCGLMIDQPVTRVRAVPSNEFACGPAHRGRIEAIADRLSQWTGRTERPAVRIDVLESAPAHTGLGSGTQLSLAIAESMMLCKPAIAPETIQPGDGSTLLKVADRGHRSAVGCHGYFRGGFIVEGVDASNPNRLTEPAFRCDVPPSWRVAIWLPESPHRTAAVSGDVEQSRFNALPKVSSAVRDSLVTCLTRELQPAIAGADFVSFASAVTDYNRRAGELFSSVQGGPYNGTLATGGVAALIAAGIVGVGQSSWGPGLFGWFDSPAAADRAVAIELPGYKIGWIAAPLNQPRTAETMSGGKARPAGGAQS